MISVITYSFIIWKFYDRQPPTSWCMSMISQNIFKAYANMAQEIIGKLQSHIDSL